jgi:5-oxoprolinase (ATP-hydrolysing) subunit C
MTSPWLEIEEAGPATSVQDAGRFGAQRFGLVPAGAMDRFALAAANALVGADADAAAIEVGPWPLRLTAREGAARLALWGAERQAAAAGRPVNPGETFRLAAGETLTVKAARGGVFTYLAIEGGIQGAPVFGSLSVHRRAMLGSPYPRPLRAGDRLDLQRAAAPTPERRLTLAPPEPGPIRVVLGPQDDYFDAASIALFLASLWRVSATSDRMGYRLEGPRLAHAKGANIVSDGVPMGAIQVPGNSQPMVLLAERGTTGGYPKIAVIIGPDIGRFAQTPAGAPVRFAALGIEAAQDAARAFAAEMARLPGRVETIAAAPSNESLLAANLAGGAVSALDADTWN